VKNNSAQAVDEDHPARSIDLTGHTEGIAGSNANTISTPGEPDHQVQV
jgi:hypothetical protein